MDQNKQTSETASKAGPGAPGRLPGNSSESSLPRDNLKSRLYLRQNQPFSKPKKAKLFDLSDASSSEFVGVRTAPDSVSTIASATTGGRGFLGPSSTTPTFYGSTPPHTAAGGGRKLQTSHGEQFCSPGPQYGTIPSHLPLWTPELGAERIEVSDPPPSRSLTRYQLPRPTSESSKRRPNTVASLKSVLSAHENWKRKRGKFALAAKHQPPNYAWMPFLDLLKKQPNTMEFIYLQPPRYPKTAEFDPYELEIVTYGEIDSPYHYTMSAQGVTLFRDNDADKRRCEPLLEELIVAYLFKNPSRGNPTDWQHHLALG